MSNNKGKEKQEDINVNANKKQASDGYKKLPDNPKDSQDDYSVSTADDSANGKYSRTDVRKEDIDKNTTRGGS